MRTSGEGYELLNSRVDSIPHAANDLKRKAQVGLRWLDGLIAGRDNIAGGRSSLADISLFMVMDFMKDAGQPLDRSLRHVSAWFDHINARASVQASIHSSAAALHWTVLNSRLGHARMKEPFNVVVIGSGFGGAVAAARRDAVLHLVRAKLLRAPGSPASRRMPNRRGIPHLGALLRSSAR